MLRVDCARWGQTPEDLRELATSAPHPRTRERFLARYEITAHSCATRVAPLTRRHPQTVMEWVHIYNSQGPEALAYRRTAGPCAASSAGCASTSRSGAAARPSVRPDTV